MGLFVASMDTRRLVVWISAGLLGFQAAALLLGLMNCLVYSWLSAPPGLHLHPRPSDAEPRFCELPQQRINEAVSQGLNVLAGLGLGGAVGVGNSSQL